MTQEELFLRRFLNIYWLRPENAMWRSVNAQSMADLDFPEPSLDSSCGDGLYSFVRAGGDLTLDFDVYSGVGDLERFYENADIYDATAASYAPCIAREADYKITVGIDWKDNLLAKAAALGLYRETKVHDNNQPLPFADNHFRTIFSNSAYWIENLELHMSELARVLHPEGKAILVLMTGETRDYTLDGFREQLGDDWLALVDRGRKENYRGLRRGHEWDAILEAAGFEVVERRPQIGWVQSFIEYVGLRPISPLMIEMANALPEDKRRELKAKWIDTWVRLLLPFNKPNVDFGKALPPVEYIYILRKKQ